MRRRQPGMSPEKIAIAVAVTIAAIAGTGGMKKVTGTSSAVAMVAVRPGTAPTKRPNSAEKKMTARTYGSAIRPRACRKTSTGSAGASVEDRQHAPGQGDAQQLVEREVDGERGCQGDDHREPRLHPQLQEDR